MGIIKTVHEKIEDKIPSNDDIMTLLDTTYKRVCDGVPFVSEPVQTLANDYLDKNKTKEAAVKAMLKNQIRKCTTSGVITGFGGIVTLPVSVPANVSSVLYVQMRMIAATAYIGGFDLRSDQVQTFIYACLAGVSINQVIKKFGINFSEKIATSGIKKIPGKVLTIINQRVGFRFITKFGEKGLINMGKLVPVAGAAVSGAFDYAETKAIAARAYKMFFEYNFDLSNEKNIDNSVDEEIAQEES